MAFLSQRVYCVRLFSVRIRDSDEYLASLYPLNVLQQTNSPNMDEADLDTWEI